MRTHLAASALAVALGWCGPGAAGGPAHQDRTPAPQRQVQPAIAAGQAGVPLARLSGLVGRPVLRPDGAEAGRVESLLVDPAGQVRAVVIAWGGFIGVGDRRAALPIRLLHRAGDGVARIALTAEQLEALPDFDPNHPEPAARRLGWPGGLHPYP